jgi:hypothetical protein
VAGHQNRTKSNGESANTGQCWLVVNPTNRQLAQSHTADESPENAETSHMRIWSRGRVLQGTGVSQTCQTYASNVNMRLLQSDCHTAWEAASAAVNPIVHKHQTVAAGSSSSRLRCQSHSQNHTHNTDLSRLPGRTHAVCQCVDQSSRVHTSNMTQTSIDCHTDTHMLPQQQVPAAAQSVSLQAELDCSADAALQCTHTHSPALQCTHTHRLSGTAMLVHQHPHDCYAVAALQCIHNHTHNHVLPKQQPTLCSSPVSAFAARSENRPPDAALMPCSHTHVLPKQQHPSVHQLLCRLTRHLQ